MRYAAAWHIGGGGYAAGTVRPCIVYVIRMMRRYCVGHTYRRMRGSSVARARDRPRGIASMCHVVPCCIDTGQCGGVESSTCPLQALLSISDANLSRLASRLTASPQLSAAPLSRSPPLPPFTMARPISGHGPPSPESSPMAESFGPDALSRSRASLAYRSLHPETRP
jgi:hypothetical protein